MLKWLVSQSESAMYLVDVPLRTQVITVASFMHLAWKELGLKAATIICCLSGVRHHFRTNLFSLEVFEHASVLACKTALTLEERRSVDAVEVYI
jgi:cytochrome c oxidase subunit IV